MILVYSGCVTCWNPESIGLYHLPNTNYRLGCLGVASIFFGPFWMWKKWRFPSGDAARNPLQLQAEPFIHSWKIWTDNRV